MYGGVCVSLYTETRSDNMWTIGDVNMSEHDEISRREIESGLC